LTTYMDNPAGRLAEVLNAAIDAAQFILEDKEGNPYKNAPATEVWSLALGTSTLTELLIRLGEVLRLLEDAKVAVRSLPSDDAQFYARAFEELDKLPILVNGSLGADWKVFSATITPQAVFVLETVSRMLRTVALSPTLTESGIEEILVDLRQMIDQVSAHSSLPRDARLYVLKLLRNAEGALIGYRIGGFESVAAAVAAVAAGAALIPEENERSWLRERLGQLWRLMISRAQGVQAISDSTQSVMGAVEGVDKFLS
jgi:hypothetical protein